MEIACSSCGNATDELALFPGGICLACYEQTDEAKAPLTANGIITMWGGKPV